MELNSATGHEQPVIPLKPLDTWKGVTDPKRRKTLQNRLNQRAYRRRQQALRTLKAEHAIIAKRESSDPESITLAYPSSTPLPSSIDNVDLCNLRGLDANEHNKRILEELETVLRVEYAKGSPRADLLLGLRQLNVVRALHANTDIIGYKDSDMHDDALSMFNRIRPLQPPAQGYVHKSAGLLPPALQPTSKQYTVPHHPWLDLIPIPKMRDNLIQAGDSYDDLRLCHDMCGYRVPATGIIVWKEPWDPSGWEVTEPFLTKWGWTVKDCWDLFQSTNHWRKRRGEKFLFRLPIGCSQGES